MPAEGFPVAGKRSERSVEAPSLSPRKAQNAPEKPLNSILRKLDVFGAETLLYSCPYVSQKLTSPIMIRSLLVLSLFAGAIQASAQVVPRDSTGQTALTIDQAIELARRNNPALQQTLNNRIGARAAVRSAYGALLPSVDASLSAQRQQGGQQIFSGTSLGARSDVNQSSYQIGFYYRINSATLITPSLQRANRDAVEADITGERDSARQCAAAISVGAPGRGDRG